MYDLIARICITTMVTAATPTDYTCDNPIVETRYETLRECETAIKDYHNLVNIQLTCEQEQPK